jgi:uncharacterized protein YhaN
VKILKLDLLRFGPFTDLSLDFSSPARGLHVVIGSNEAGKSTTLRAVLGLLFGIPARTTDGHVHEMSELRIAATLAPEEGPPLMIVRRKGNKNTLLDPEEKPVEEAAFRRQLGLAGIELQHFETMFGLSHDRLLAGGKELAEGRGDLGEGLFGAGVGQDISALLRRLEQRAQDIFMPRGKRKLNRLLDEYKDAKSRQKTLSQPLKEWEERKKELEARRAESQTLEHDLEKERARRRRLERIRRVLPLLAQREGVLAALEAHEGTLILPEDAMDDLRREQSIVDDAGPREARLAKDIQDIEAELRELVVPEALLALSPSVRRIQDELGGQKRASAEAARLAGELMQLEGQARAHAARLGKLGPGEDPVTQQLPPGFDLRVQQLERTKLTLDTEVKNAEGALLDMEARHAEQVRRGAALPQPIDAEAIVQTLERVRRAGDLEAQVKTQSRKVEAMGAKVRQEHAALPFFALPFEQVGAMRVPPRETLDRFEALLGEADKKVRALEQRLADVRQRLEQNERALEGARRGGEVPTEADLAEARAARERAWQRLLRVFFVEARPVEVEAIAAFRDERASGIEALREYEAGVRRADDLADRLFREADRVAQAAQYALERDGLLREEAARAAELSRAVEERGAELSRWRSEWQASGIEPRSPSEMRRFVADYERLVEARRAWVDAETEASGLRQRMAEHEGALRVLLAPFEQDAPTLSGLCERAQALCTKAERVKKERELHERELLQRERDIAACRAALDKHRAALEAFRVEWSEAMQGINLRPDARPEEARAVLSQWRELESTSSNAERVRRKVAAIERDARSFAEEVARLVAAAAQDLEGEAPERAAEVLSARFNAAEKDAVRRDARTRELSEKRREREDLTEKRMAAERRIEHLFARAGARTAAEFDMAWERSREVRARRAERDAIERRLFDLGDGLGLDALVAECREMTADQAAAELAAVDQSMREKAEKKSQVDQEIGKLKQQLDASGHGDGAAQAAMEAENHLAAMGVLVEDYARARLASALLQEEMKRYREKHEGPIVRRASEIFTRLTLGSFSGIRSHYEDDESRPVLRCVRGDKLVPVEGLSDGTRDQLFFALRLASLERHFDHNEPLPLVLDDILVNFDEARSMAALTALGDLSVRTQILFFSHHARVAELAREAVPAERLALHDLDALGRNARVRPAT